MVPFRLDIGGRLILAFSRLNDQSRQVVAMLPQLVSAESRAEWEQARRSLDLALNNMEEWMRHLPDYNRYVIEITGQIRNSIELLDATVIRREQLAGELGGLGQDRPDDERRFLAYRTAKPQGIPRQSRGIPWFIREFR